MQTTAPKKVVNAWAMYDWANSVYNLVITTTFFPIFYIAISFIISSESKNEIHKTVIDFCNTQQLFTKQPQLKKSLDSATQLLDGNVTKGEVLSFYRNRIAADINEVVIEKIPNPEREAKKQLFKNLDSLLTNNKTNGNVIVLGKPIKNTALYNYALAIAYFLVILMFPILSAVADNRGNKKRLMKLFCYVGALACCSFYFLNKDLIILSLILVIVAAVGYYGSQLFYNAYLPEIAAEKDRDRISAKGYIFGYIGSVLMQLIGFAIVTINESYIGLTFVLVGIWWAGFAQIPFAYLPGKNSSEAVPLGILFREGIGELKKVWHQVKKMPVLRLYLLAFFFYISGVLTVMMVAANFGKDELQLEDSKLIITIVIIQLVAILGAWCMSKLSAVIGNFFVLIVTVLIWVAICICAYYTYTETQFYFLATAVGFVMGGIQSMSRSTYSKLMPETKDNTSFFSFYDITEKIAMMIGLVIFGYIDDVTGSMRGSVLALIVFFIFGLITLLICNNRYKKLITMV
jgi:MFS transporter, UMF1 family